MRTTDTRPVSCFRSDRFFLVAGQWYFTTREGEDFGPFGSREDAEKRLARYLDTQSIIHYLRGADPEITGDDETSAHLVARLSVALDEQTGHAHHVVEIS